MPYVYENRGAPLFAASFFKLSPGPHIHAHLELIYLTEGQTVATIDGKDYRLNQGELLLVFPNQIHFYRDQCPVNGKLITFSPELLPDIQKLLNTKLPYYPIIKEALPRLSIASRIERILAAYRSDLAFDRIAAKGELLLLMVHLLQQVQLQDLPINPDSTKNVLLYCAEHYKEPITLNRMAKELHLNRCYLSHIFSDRIKISFSTLINSLRTEQACKLLCKERSITDVAYDSGFASIRTFNRVFIQNTGMTPTEYIYSKATGMGASGPL